jgi:DNA modification methylase
MPTRIARQLAELAVPIESLTLDPENARTHDARNIDAIAASLDRHGQLKPIVVQAKGRARIVRAGNGTVRAAQQLGWETIAAVCKKMTDAEAKAYAIADNRTAELAGWDEEALLGILTSFDEATLLSSGFDADHVEELSRSLHGSPKVEQDEPPPPPKEPRSKPGDLWVLGDHRLLCGDSTRLPDVQRVMGEDKAALVATDPPYLVDYTGERPNESGKDWSDSYREIDIKDAEGFFRAVFSNVIEVLGPKAAIYCWHAHKRSGEIQRIWHDLGILDHQQIVWVKPTPVFGRVYWHFRHEPCMMGWRQGDKPDHDGVHEHDSVWEVDWEGKARVTGNEHPTEKPIELFVRPILKHTKRGDIVFEPFSGSGSQIMAAQAQEEGLRQAQAPGAQEEGRQEGPHQEAPPRPPARRPKPKRKKKKKAAK